MKKFLTLALAIATAMSCSVVAFAENTTTLTTTVPAATYTLNIPADQEIEFGAVKTDIGAITVTDASGFAKGKDVKLTVSHTEFTSDTVNTTIPYQIYLDCRVSNNKIISLSSEPAYFRGLTDGTVQEYIMTQKDDGHEYEYGHTDVHISSEDWGKALGGNYVSVITFTTEVVVEN